MNHYAVHQKLTQHCKSTNVDVESLSLCNPMACNVAHQALPSMGFSRQEYWSGLPFPSPRDLPDPGTEPMSLALAGGFFTTESPGKTNYNSI